MPSLRTAHGLGTRPLAVALLCVSAGSFAMLLAAPGLIGHLGARGTARVAGLVFAFGLAFALPMPTPLLWPTLVLFGAAQSAFDIAINADGSALEFRAQRPMMSGFHAMFSVGAMLGAAATAALVRFDVAAEVQLGSIGALLVAGTLVASGGMPNVRPAPVDGDAAFPRGALLSLGLLVAVGLLAEGAMYDWSVLYLRDALGLPHADAALGYVAFAGAMAVARLAGDGLRARYGDATILAGGASLAALAMAGALVTADPAVTLVGFAGAGVGLGVVIPVLYVAATRLPGVPAAVGIATVSAMGMVGLMTGPPLVGGVAHQVGLVRAMWIVAGAAVVLAVGAAMRRPAALRPSA